MKNKSTFLLRQAKQNSIFFIPISRRAVSLIQIKRRITSLILILAITLSFSAAVLAVDESQNFLFRLRSSEQSDSVSIEQGKEFTLEFRLMRTDLEESELYTLYAMQNEVEYNTEYLELLSVEITEDFGGSGIVSYLDRSDRTHRRILINSGTNGMGEYAANLLVAKIMFRALKDGVTPVTNENTKMINRSGTDTYLSDTSNVTVTIGIAGPEPNPGPGTGGGTVSPDREITIDDDDTPLTAPGIPRFSDVSAEHWAYAFIEYLAELGFVNGKTVTLYYPGDTITRGEFITILARMSGENMPDYSGEFNDVSASDYYAGAVSWGFVSGIIKGTSKTTFSPKAKISRQDIAVMIARYTEYMGYSFGIVNEPTEFTDAAEIAEYAEYAVSSMHRANIINGYGDGSFKPRGNATRAEAAKLLALLHHAMYPDLLSGF